MDDWKKFEWDARHFRPYLYDRKFLVKCDHKPLIYLFGMKNSSSKLTRIRLVLEEYDFEAKHIKGKDNVVADAVLVLVYTRCKTS